MLEGRRGGCTPALLLSGAGMDGVGYTAVCKNREKHLLLQLLNQGAVSDSVPPDKYQVQATGEQESWNDEDRAAKDISGSCRG